MLILSNLLLLTSLFTGATPQDILVHPGETSGANIHFHLGLPGQGAEEEGAVEEGQDYQDNPATPFPTPATNNEVTKEGHIYVSYTGIYICVYLCKTQHSV